jgi:putative transposase
MDEYESLSHTKWECKYHVVFIPKCRRKTLFGHIRRNLGEVFHKLALQKECRIEEGHLQPDHVHNVDRDSAEACGVASDRVHQGQERDPHCPRYGERKRNFVGQSFWARGFFVSTVGRDEEVIRAYIKNQESEDHRLEQLKLWP